MTLDSSAIVVILATEPEGRRLARLLAESVRSGVSAPTDRFGEGRHVARLNFGDCMTYAVARIAGEPLLCTGNDFARTDLTLVA